MVVKNYIIKNWYINSKLEISPKTNSLEVSVVNDNGGTNIIIPNKITINDWTHIAVVVTRKFMEVYINGKLLKTKPINGKVKTDLSDVIISENSGFSGSIKNLRYFNKQVSAADIYSIYQREKPQTYIPSYFLVKTKNGTSNKVKLYQKINQNLKNHLPTLFVHLVKISKITILIENLLCCR